MYLLSDQKSHILVAAARACLTAHLVVHLIAHTIQPIICLIICLITAAKVPYIVHSYLLTLATGVPGGSKTFLVSLVAPLVAEVPLEKCRDGPVTNKCLKERVLFPSLENISNLDLDLQKCAHHVTNACDFVQILATPRSLGTKAQSCCIARNIFL